MRWGVLVLALWAGVAVALTGWLMAGQFMVSRILRKAQVLDSSDWVTPLYEIADRLGLEHAPRLYRSDDISMPFACGLRTPAIVMPSTAETWSAEQRAAVLLHEMAHIKRRDIVGHTVGRFACAVYWFHPLVWTAAKRLRAESERACDDMALLSGARPSDYAEHLLDIVARVRRNSTPSLALAMATRSEFEGRMLAILDPALRRTAPSRRQAASLVLSIVTIGVVIGLAAPATSVAADPSTATDRLASAANDAVVPPTAEFSLEVERGVWEQQRLSARDTVSRPLPPDAVASVSRAPLPIEPPSRPEPAAAPTVSIHLPMASPASPEAPAQPGSKRSTPRQAGIALAEIIGLAFASAATEIATTSVGAASQALGAVKIAFDQIPTDTASRRERMELLQRMLRTDQDADVRRIAAWGLRNDASTPAITASLINAVRSDAAPEVRETAAWALSSAGSSRQVVAALVQSVREDGSAAVRTTSTWALGVLAVEPSDAVVSAVTRGLSHEHAPLREVAAWTLGVVRPAVAPNVLLSALTDTNDDVRRSAAWAVHQIGDARAAAALERAIAEEDEREVRLIQVRALGTMGERGARVLQRLLDDRDADVRSLALRMITGADLLNAWPQPRPRPRPTP